MFNEVTDPKYMSYVHENMVLMQKAGKIESRYLADFIAEMNEFNWQGFFKLWDYFRMNDPICLAKFPSIAHIIERNKDGLTVDPEHYEMARAMFETLITAPHNHKMLMVFNNDPDQPNVFISCKESDIANPFWLIAQDNRIAHLIKKQGEKYNMDHTKKLLSIGILNMDGPFDEDPDREPDVIA